MTSKGTLKLKNEMTRKKAVRCMNFSEELFQACSIALFDALDTFNPALGISFECFAKNIIKREMKIMTK